MTGDLFADLVPDWHEAPGDGTAVLRGFALPALAQLLPCLEGILQQAPLHRMLIT